MKSYLNFIRLYVFVDKEGIFLNAPIHYAAAKGESDVLEYFFKMGADPNSKRIVDNVHYPLGGAPLNIPKSDAKFPALNDTWSIINLLRRHGADFNIPTQTTDGSHTSLFAHVLTDEDRSQEQKLEELNSLWWHGVITQNSDSPDFQTWQSLPSEEIILKWQRKLEMKSY